VTNGNQLEVNGKLFFFCGKMRAGKTTKSKKIAHDRNAVLISEDEWLELSELYRSFMPPKHRNGFVNFTVR
jgi:hypothetical protein